MARTELTKQKATQAQALTVDELRERSEAGVQNRVDFASTGLSPDWMSTGLAGAGAGWVFGPVGGLIGAAVAAVASKKRRAGIVAQATADQATGESLITAGERSIASLEAAAVTEQDKFEASLAREQFNQAATLAMHPNPSVAAAGFQSLLAVPGMVDDEADEIEASQLAREQVNRDKAQQIFTNFQTIKDDFRIDSKSFELERDAYKKLSAGLDAESAAGDLSAIFSFMKQVDPISVVREGEFATAANAGSVDERTRGLYNRVLTGERLTDSQRRDFQNRGTDLYKVSLDRYLNQESRMITESQFAKVPNELIDSAKLPWVTPLEMKQEPDLNVPTGDGEVTRRVIEPSGMAQGLTTLGNEVMNTFADLGRLGRGEKVVQEGNRFFVEDADGNKIREAEDQNAGFPNLLEAQDAAREAEKTSNRDRFLRGGTIHPIERRVND